MNSLLGKIQACVQKGEWPALVHLVESDSGTRVHNVTTQLLEHLDIKEFSAAWCVLLAKYNTGGHKAYHEKFLTQVETFFARMDVEQVRGACVEKVGPVSHKYAEVCRAVGTPGRGIRHLLGGIEKLRLGPDCLTPLHADYVCLCLLRKQYVLVKDLLSVTIFDVGVECGTVPCDMLLYYYYGGMAWIGLKDFERALSFLETCICAPAAAPSAVAVEAYKKYILVCLIARGKMLPWPKHCPRAVVKFLRQRVLECKPYFMLAKAFTTAGGGAAGDEGGAQGNSTATTLRGAEAAGEVYKIVYAKHKELFQSHKNWGLAKQAVAASTRQMISRLTFTYDTLSFADIASSVGLSGPEEVESVMRDMISNREVFATLHDREKMAHFTDSPSADFGASVSEQLAALKELTLRIKQQNEALKDASNSDDRAMARNIMGKGEKRRKQNLVNAVLGVFKE
ncbi:COP9 signalosome complex subunit 3 [Diplonema papillatum]|nr:COP9 signalosome complex subunit 3 [Diplonema papillatum]